MGKSNGRDQLVPAGAPSFANCREQSISQGRLQRASWDVIAAAAESLDLSLGEGDAPHARYLHFGGEQMAEVTFSTDLRWYRLALPLTNGQSLSHQLSFTHSNLSLARTASDGSGLYLLADIPASLPGFLAASLTIWQDDVKQVTALVTGNTGNQQEVERTYFSLGENPCEGSEPSQGWFPQSEMYPAEIDAGLRVTPVAAGTDAGRIVQVFLSDLEADWDVTQDDEAVTWRLVRRPAASRRLPPVCQLSLADGLASLTTMVPLGDKPPADTCDAARSLFLLRLSSGWHVAGSLLPGGAQLRAALPVPGLQTTHLRTAYDVLLESYKFSALELQALGEGPLALLYLRLQTNY